MIHDADRFFPSPDKIFSGLERNHAVANLHERVGQRADRCDPSSSVEHEPNGRQHDAGNDFFYSEQINFSSSRLL